MDNIYNLIKILKENSRELSLDEVKFIVSFYQAQVDDLKGKIAEAKTKAKEIEKKESKELAKELFGKPTKKFIIWNAVVAFLAVVISVSIITYYQTINERFSISLKERINAVLGETTEPDNDLLPSIKEYIIASTTQGMILLKNDILSYTKEGIKDIEKKTDNTLKGLNNKVDSSLSALKKDTESRLKEIDAKITDSVSKIDVVDKKITSGIDSSLSKLKEDTESQLRDIDAKIESVEKKVTSGIDTSLSKLKKDTESQLNNIDEKITNSISRINAVEKKVMADSDVKIEIIRLLDAYKEEFNNYRTLNDLQMVYKLKLVEDIGGNKYNLYIEAFNDFGINKRFIPKSNSVLYQWDIQMYKLYSNWINTLEKQVDKSQYVPSYIRGWDTHKSLYDDNTDYNWSYSSKEITFSTLLWLVKTDQEFFRKQIELNGYNINNIK